MAEVNFNYFVLSLSEATKLFFIFVPSRKWRGEEGRGTVSLSVARGGWILEDLVRVVAFYDSSPGRGIVGEAIASIGAQTDSQSNIVSLLEKAQNRSRVAITSESYLET